MPSRHAWGGDYELTAEDAAEFMVFWDAFKRAEQRSVVDAALRRFSYAADRHRTDDRLVDLAICAETLFLGGSDSPQDRGELRYRFSLRAASFIDIDATKRETFRFMRNTYDARSAIVHGGSPESEVLCSLGGERVELEVFTDAVEGVLRLALRKAVTLNGPRRGPLLDWDELILG